MFVEVALARRTTARRGRRRRAWALPACCAFARAARQAPLHSLWGAAKAKAKAKAKARPRRRAGTAAPGARSEAARRLAEAARPSTEAEPPPRAVGPSPALAALLRAFRTASRVASHAQALPGVEARPT